MRQFRNSHLVKYLASRLDVDLWVILTFSIITAAFVFVPFVNETAIRSVLGLTFTVFIPGYAILAAVFARKADLEDSVRIALSFGFSLAVASLVGVILTLSALGVEVASITLSLILLTVVCVAIANLRRHKIAENDRFSPKIRHLKPR